MIFDPKIRNVDVNLYVLPIDLVAHEVDKLFAFSTMDGRPHVFEFSLDEAGLSGLANLLRAETVLAVVRGVRAEVSNESVIKIRAGDSSMEHRMQL